MEKTYLTIAKIIFEPLIMVNDSMADGTGWKRFALKAKKTEIDTVKSFYFESKESPMYFAPGQHIVMRFHDLEGDQRGKMRHFSISTSPLEGKYIGITTTVDPNGSPFKKKLDSVKVGEDVDILGPVGNFTFESKIWNDRIIVLIAGGIGITPFRSMIRYALSTSGNFRIHLFYSGKSGKEFIFRDELDKMAATDKRLRIFYTSTGETASGTPNIHAGRIDHDFITTNVEDLGNSFFYICGPPRMVEEIAGTARSDLGIEKDRIKTEQFLGY
ncbi:Sulfhydrogenase 2 subunit gamma [Thermoplasmatales archaeon]|nr:Sulfhydrogenase 2 subunit gamma [Thermoplasmatales archaeon]